MMGFTDSIKRPRRSVGRARQPPQASSCFNLFRVRWCGCWSLFISPTVSISSGQVERVLPQDEAKRKETENAKACKA